MQTRSRLGWAIKVAVAAGLMPVALQVNALQYEVSDDLKVSVDTTLTYGRQWRVEGRDNGLMTTHDAATILGKVKGSSFSPLEMPFKSLVQKNNSDDGDRNFARWDTTSSRFAGISDIDISYKNVGLFLRPQAFYDEVPYGETNWTCKQHCNPALYDPQGYGGRGILNNYWPHNPEHFRSDYKDAGSDIGFLDVYAYGTFDIGDKQLDLRVGRQVISWGEALMLQNGISVAQNRMDANAATAPGAELKEIFLPTGAVYGKFSASESVTLEAYWQYEFLPTKLMPTGSFMEMQDFIDGDVFLTQQGGSFGSGALAKVDVNEPDPNKQFGFAFRYLMGEGTEASLFIVNYIDKFPMFWAFNKNGSYDGLDLTTNAAGYGSYSTGYFDNIRMYGLSLNTVVGGVQTGIEYAYRANAPVVPACTESSIKNHHCRDPFYAAFNANAGNPDGTYYGPGSENALVSWPTRAEVHTLNIGGTYIFQPNMLWDTATLVGELGGWYIGSGFRNDDLQFAHLGAFTKYGEGMSAQFMPEYKNVFEGVDLTVPFFINYGIDGSMSTMAFNEHNLWWSIGAEFQYLEHWKFSGYYNNFSGPNNLWVDRDNISLNVKYAF